MSTHDAENDDMMQCPICTNSFMVPSDDEAPSEQHLVTGWLEEKATAYFATKNLRTQLGLAFSDVDAVRLANGHMLYIDFKRTYARWQSFPVKTWGHDLLIAHARRGVCLLVLYDKAQARRHAVDDSAPDELNKDVTVWVLDLADLDANPRADENADVHLQRATFVETNVAQLQSALSEWNHLANHRGTESICPRPDGWNWRVALAC